MTDSVLQSLVSESWRQYAQYERAPYIVRPAAPILFFGDLDSYLQSAMRVVTVGLNPSKVEFPEDDRFCRFRDAEGNADADQPDADRYLNALNTYFRESPYRRWFNSFEPLLNGLNSSYYGSLSNTALHTDLCSPLATDPTWSKLKHSEKATLEERGTPLWHALIRFLDPDVIIISVARDYLDRVEFAAETPWETISTIELKQDGTPRAKPYEIRAARLVIGTESSASAVFGQAAQTPFGSIASDAKTQIGAQVLELANGL